MELPKPETPGKLDFYEKTFLIALLGVIIYILFYLDAEGIVVSGVTIWYTDIIYLFLFVLILRQLFSKSRSRVHFKRSFSLYLFVALIFVTAAVNVVLYGLQIIGLMRAYVPIVLTIYTILFLRKEKAPLMFEKLTKYTVPIILIALFVLDPKASWGPPHATTELRQEYQILNSSSVLFIAVLFIYFVAYNRLRTDKKTISYFLVVFLLFIIIFQQHRSVWMFTFAALLTYGVKSSAITARSLGKLTLPLVLILIFATIYSQMSPGALSSISESLSQSFQGILTPEADETSNWRLLYLQSAMSGIGEHLIFGVGFKETMEIYIGNQISLTSPHSFYLALLMYYGLMGLTIFLIYIVDVIMKLNRSIKANWNDASQRSYYLFVQCCIVGFLAFGLAYGFDPIMFLIFGLAEL